MTKSFQRTIQRTVTCSGVALHTGRMVTLELRPAQADTGIVFERSDLPGRPQIKVTPHAIFDTTLATRIGTPEISVSTIEHLMAAFFGFGIDNIYVAIDGPEMPILDGSAAPFLVILDEAGVCELGAERRVLIVNKTIEVVDEKNPTRFIRIEPSKEPLISYAIDFEKAATIGRQHVSFHYTAKAFCEEFSIARTFCLSEEIEFMRSRGLAKGGSLENALVVSAAQGELLNQNGLRTEFEFVRHKALDCIGDLHTVGMPILGHVIAHKAGHDLHGKLARALLEEGAPVTILTPSTVSARSRRQDALRSLLSFPKSLLEIERPLSALPVG